MSASLIYSQASLFTLQMAAFLLHPPFTSIPVVSFYMFFKGYQLDWIETHSKKTEREEKCGEARYTFKTCPQSLVFSIQALLLYNSCSSKLMKEATGELSNLMIQSLLNSTTRWPKNRKHGSLSSTLQIGINKPVTQE